MLKNNTLKTNIIICLIISIFFSFIFPDKVKADKNVTQLEYQGVINKKMKYQNEIWADYPNSNYGNYPETIQYEKDGFKGTLHAKKIKLVPVGEPKNQWVRGRTINHTDYWSDYYEFKEDFKRYMPDTLKGTYKDKITGKTVSYKIPKSGGFYKTGRGRIINEEITSNGNVFNYDKKDNTMLGYMSNNKRTYWGGKLYFSRPPRRPKDYYGRDRNFVDTSSYKLIDAGWADSAPINADNFRLNKNCKDLNGRKVSCATKVVKRNGSYWFRSESGIYNKYRKGVWLKYRVRVRENEYRQKYSGTIKLPDYVDYQYADKWKVYVEYSGEVEDLRTNNYYIKDLKVTPQRIDLGSNKGAKATRPITFNFTIGNESYPAYNKNPLNPTVRIKHGNSILWEGAVSVLPNEISKKSVTVKTLIRENTNVFTVEVNPDKKMLEYKPNVDDVYKDNMKKVGIQGVIHETCEECATKRQNNRNEWMEKWEWYEQSGTVKNGIIGGESYQYCEISKNKSWSEIKSYYEEYKIKDIYFRSKWTKDKNKDDYPEDGKGWMKVTNGGVGKIKAGYGFEIKIVTNYNTNRNVAPLPNNKQSNPYKGDSKGKYGSGYSDYTLRYPGVTPTDSPNVVYMNMPYKQGNKKMCYILSSTSSTKWYNNDKVFELPIRKSFNIKNERKAYVSPNVKTGKYRIDVLTPRPDKPNKFLGYEPENTAIVNNMNRSRKQPLHDCDFFYIEILAQDDLKSHIMQ